MYSINQLCIFTAKRIVIESKSLALLSNPSRNLFYVSSDKSCSLRVSNDVILAKNFEYKRILCPTNSASPSLIQILTRNTSFFKTLSAAELWKGVTSVSNAGRKRGRGKAGRRMKVRNLNRGQPLGSGKINMVWPGLNQPVLKGQKVMEQTQLPPNTERLEKLHQMRDKMGVFRPMKLDPLERGWAGIRWGGKSVGAPDPIGTEMFKGFNTTVLESKMVCKMDGKMGRKRSTSMFVVTGNKNGIAGFGKGKANLLKDAIRRAKNRSGQRLVYVDRCDGHTVYHDFFCQFLKTKIFVSRKPPGYGLVCHRAIKAICEVLGIKDLHAKIEGSTNVQNLTKAFFLGLLNQKTHEQMAEEKKLHVVKLAPGDYPRVVASPKDKVRTREEIPYDEELDYSLYTMDGRVVLPRKKFEPFYKRMPSYERFLNKEVKRRNHTKINLQLRIAHGGRLESFYTKDYPECKEYVYVPEEKEVEEEEEY